MTKAETAALATMTPEQLIEGFVRESKLVEISINGGRGAEATKHVDAVEAYGDEIRDRGGLPVLAPLMDGADPFLAYSAARRLARLDEFRERALAVLDHIAKMNVGTASFRSDTARNVIRYGNPNGDPVEYEKRLAAIRARENRA